MSADPYTLERRLCDDAGMVSHEPWENAFGPDLTYLQQLNNLRSHTGLKPVAEPFHCTGSAHLACEHIRCTSPAHRVRQQTWPPAPVTASEIYEQIRFYQERLKDHRVIICSPEREEHVRQLLTVQGLPDMDVRGSSMVTGSTVYVVGRVDF